MMLREAPNGKWWVNRGTRSSGPWTEDDGWRLEDQPEDETRTMVDYTDPDFPEGFPPSEE